MSDRERILVVDDVPANVRLLKALLTAEGYDVLDAGSGPSALEIASKEAVDLLLLDVRMPEMDGHEVCRRLRADPETSFLPIIMITSEADEERVAAIEAGADDFVVKPFNQQELLARVRSLIRVKRYHDTIEAQRAQLTALNADLERRVETQVAELERLGRLRRFLPPQLVDVALSAGADSVLESHRREIAVIFADLAGWTAFSETTEPEEVMGVIREFHDTIGAIIMKSQATIGWFAGDGVMAWFNDPFPTKEPAAKAAAMAIGMRDAMTARTVAWRQRGHQLDFRVGISLGYATIGMVGFEGRFEYGAVGSVLNLASRLSDEAGAGQILMSARAFSSAERRLDGERIPDLKLKGFAKPVMAYRVRGMRVEPRSARSQPTDHAADRPESD